MAKPFSPGNAFAAADVARERIRFDKAYIGSCTNGSYQDLLSGDEGQYRVRLMDNTHAWDAAYPGLELLPDGTFVTTTYGYWEEGAEPYIVSVRFTMQELDHRAGDLR